MDRAEALSRAAVARSGHLATVGGDGSPHLVVITFAIVGDRLVTAIDHKPKSTTRLQRLVNIESNPRASFLVDHYEESWDSLWWVRIDGEARIVEDGPDHSRAIDALEHKYPQYRSTPPHGPVISLSIDRVIQWASTP